MDGINLRKICFILIFLLLTISSYAEDANFGIFQASLEPLKIKPGTVVAKGIILSNKGISASDFTGKVILPSEWKLLTGRGPKKVKINHSDTFLLSFYVPASYPAGIYQVTYIVTSNADPAKEYTLKFNVEILSNRKIDLQLIQAPDYALAGDRYKVVFSVWNKGNVPLEIALKGTTNSWAQFRMDTKGFELKPGSSRGVNVYITTQNSLSKTDKNLFQLEAFLPGYPETQKKEPSIVTILPRISGIEKRYHEIPSTFSLNHNLEHAEEDRYATQLEIQGEGTLDQEGNKKVRYLIRQPFNPESPLATQKEIWKLSLDTQDWSFRAGDEYFLLSKLSHSTAAGKGVGLTYKMQDYSLSGFTHLDSTGSPSPQYTGLKYTLHTENIDNINFYYLDQQSISPVGIGGINVSTQMFDQNFLDLEYSSSKGTTLGEAYYASFRGIHSKLNYRLQYLYADTDYSGSYQNRNNFLFGTSLPLKKNLRLNSSLYYNLYNLNQEFPSYDEYWNNSLNWRVNPQTTLTGGIKYGVKQLDADELAVNYELTNLQLTHKRDGLQVKVSSENGIQKDPLIGNSEILERFKLSLDYTQNSIIYHSLWAYEFDEWKDESRTLYTLGGGIEWAITPDSSVKFDVETQNYRDSYYSGRDSFTSTFQHTFIDGSRFRAQGTYFPERLDVRQDYRIYLEYRRSFFLPISAKKETRRLEGVVYKQETKEPIADVVLRLGDKVAVTDIYGRFLFHSLKEGRHYLVVEEQKDSFLVPINRIPMEVNIKDSGLNNIEIALAEPAEVTGTVLRKDFVSKPVASEPPPVLGEGKPFGNLILFLESKELGIRKAVSDGNGTFDFTGLSPGSWVLTIDKSRIPDQYYIEESKWQLELQPGKTKDLTIEILPVFRPVQIIDEGIIIIEEE